jgi:hypothetical protein
VRQIKQEAKWMKPLNRQIKTGGDSKQKGDLNHTRGEQTKPETSQTKPEVNQKIGGVLTNLMGSKVQLNQKRKYYVVLLSSC